MTIMTLTNDNAKRIYSLNDKAVKAAVTSALALQAASAAGMFMLMHGHSQFINDLYKKLLEASPKDANALRVMFAPKVIDTFGEGGVRKPDDVNVWLKRPVAFFTFGSKEGFALVDVKKNTSLSASDIKHIKAARKAIREAGEEALNFQWKTRDQEEREAEAMDAAKMQTAVRALLIRIAKNAGTNGMTKDKLASAGRVFGLTPDAIGKVTSAFNDGINDGQGALEDDEEGGLGSMEAPELIAKTAAKQMEKEIPPAHVN